MAECLAKLLRIYAPESPFPSDEELLHVFRLMLWALGLLGKPEKTTFALSFSILQITHQVRAVLFLSRPNPLLAAHALTILLLSPPPPPSSRSSCTCCCWMWMTARSCPR